MEIRKVKSLPLLLSMLLAFLVTAIPARADFGDCTSRDYVRSFDTRLTSGTCEEVSRFQIRFVGGPVPMRVLRTSDSGHGASTLMVQHVEALAARLGPAMDAMARLKLMPVSVMLTDLPPMPGSARDVHAITATRAGDECIVTYYKQAGAVSVEEFVFTYAHEIFHCIQKKTWPSRMVPGGTWWIESTAEYFANLVQQGTRYSDDFVADFDRQSNTRSVLDMTYPNVVLFFWLGQNGGPGAIRTSIEMMPDVSSCGAQLAALQLAVPRGPWTRFGQEYYDGKVRQPGGRLIASPRAAAQTPLTIGGTGSHVLSTPDAYVLTRREVTFEKGRSYGLTLTPTTPHVQTRMTHRVGNPWDKPPPRVNACSENMAYRVIVTSTEASGTNQLGVEASPRLAEGACCLIGKWSPTPPTLASFAEQQGSVPGIAGTCRHTGGTWILGFAGNGTGNIDWKSYTTECKTPNPGMVGITQENGSYDFRWTYDRDHVTVTYTSSTLMHRLKLSIGGRDAVNDAQPVNLPAEPQRTHGILHTCRGDALQVRGLLTIPVVSDHTRIIEHGSR
jgi:hypothetical protein